MAISFFKGVKNASYLAIGNLISQLISFIGFIYIARLLGPDDYGIYVSVGAFVGMFEIFLLTGLHKTIIRESSKDIRSMQIVLEKTIGVRNILIILAAQRYEPQHFYNSSRKYLHRMVYPSVVLCLLQINSSLQLLF